MFYTTNVFHNIIDIFSKNVNLIIIKSRKLILDINKFCYIFKIWMTVRYALSINAAQDNFNQNLDTEINKIG